MNYSEAINKFWKDFGMGMPMVLSTSLGDSVTSRMVSLIQIKGKLYFQSDLTFTKAIQIKGNKHVALCINNIQIEGDCEEIGTPSENEYFINIYKQLYLGSYNLYSSLENERVFVIDPVKIKRWLYVNKIPHMETLNTTTEEYSLERYIG